MKVLFLYVITIFFNSTIINTEVKNSPHYIQNKANQTDWIDAKIAEYIKYTTNHLIRITQKSGLKIDKIYDQEVTRDGKTYSIYNLGHNVFDENYSNKRFVSDAWIYIDVKNKKLYVYDLPNDMLVLWKKPVKNNQKHK